ncbi:UNVERIFIED_CONTAM: hypothetical protein GTU68_035765 [Idotea baltica]|nr:hypothetical protein [Idotea baltica]
MSSKDQNLSNYSLNRDTAKSQRIGIVVSDWNQDITHRLLEGCKETLLQEGISAEDIYVINVPGAFELPTGARMIDDRHNLDAIICLGCVIKGETQHDQYINNAIAHGIVQLGMLRSKPFIYGVLTPNNMSQAEDRAGGDFGNKGVEAAVTALKMIMVKEQLRSSSKSIGFS